MQRLNNNEILTLLQGKINLRGDNCSVSITKISGLYYISFSCNLNGDYHHEVSYQFLKLDSNALNILNAIFEDSEMFTIPDLKQNIGLEIGISHTSEPTVFLSLTDYDYDCISPEVKEYNMQIDKNTPNYDKFGMLFGLLTLSKDKKEEEEHEHQLNSTKHQRQSRL